MKEGQYVRAHKKTICVDFDGVLHSYTSGWRGANVIPDPPVPGAMDFLLSLIEDERFEVCIYSSRSKEPGGISAMSAWLRKRLGDFTDQLKFPVQKPAAFLTIDDRALCFKGLFPSLDYIDGFKPWNKTAT